MNLDELRTFLEVIESGSLVAAARRLNVTPSTVTARLDALEDEVGQTLLHRAKSGTELTSPGFKFKRYAEVMVQLWGQARYEAALPKGFEAVCNVGLEYDLWAGVGSTFLNHVRSHAPGVAIALWPGTQREIDRWLGIGLIDIAFCYAPQPGERFSSRVLFEDEIVLVSTDKHASAGPGSIFVDHGDEFRRQHAAAFSHSPPSTVTIASSAWALQHMLASGGSAYLPLRIVQNELDQARLHAVQGAQSFQRRVHIVETTDTVKNWTWYGAALAAATPRPLRGRIASTAR